MRVFGDTLQKLIDEERRLFYVALTRAEEALIIITEGKDRSPFLKGLEVESDPDLLNKLEKATGDGDWLLVRVGNMEGRGSDPTKNIRDRLKAYSFRYTDDKWTNWYKPFKKKDFEKKNIFVRYPWLESADGVEIQFCAENETLLEKYHVINGKPNRII